MKARMHKGSREAGFTLVEIAIVLVIIGLLLGGILKGQEMITQAKIKNIVNDFNGIAAANNSYLDRYRSLAGDDLNAGTRWSTLSVVAGNGDGQLTGAWNATPSNPPVAGEESNLYWWHMRAAGFIPGTTAAQQSSGQQPTNAVGGMIGVQSGTGAATMGFAGAIVCSGNLPDKVAIAVDTQMDDQVAQTGQVRGFLQTSANPALPAAASFTAGTNVYAETGSNQYLLCKLM